MIPFIGNRYRPDLSAVQDQFVQNGSDVIDPLDTGIFTDCPKRRRDKVGSSVEIIESGDCVSTDRSLLRSFDDPSLFIDLAIGPLRVYGIETDNCCVELSALKVAQHLVQIDVKYLVTICDNERDVIINLLHGHQTAARCPFGLGFKPNHVTFFCKESKRVIEIIF